MHERLYSYLSYSPWNGILDERSEVWVAKDGADRETASFSLQGIYGEMKHKGQLTLMLTEKKKIKEQTKGRGDKSNIIGWAIKRRPEKELKS